MAVTYCSSIDDPGSREYLLAVFGHLTFQGHPKRLNPNGRRSLALPALGS